MIPRVKSSLFVVAILVLLSITVALGYVMFYKQKLSSGVGVSEQITQAVLVSEVPYNGRISKISPNVSIDYPAESALMSIYDYWYPGFYTASSVASKIPNNRVSFEFWTEFIDDERFSARVDYLELLDVQVLLGPSSRKPLITQLPVTPDQPTDLTTYLPVVVVGVSPKGVLVHDFWRGPALLIPHDEFSRLQNRLPESLKNRYLVITPKDLVVQNSKLSQVEKPYIRSPKLDDLGETLSLLALAELTYYEHKNPVHPELYRYYKEISTRPDFENLPRPFQARSLFSIGEYLYSEGLVDEALQVLLEANSINYGFSEPHEDWFAGYPLVTDTGNVLDRGFRTPLLIAKIYESRGDMTEARKFITQAADTVPDNAEVLAVQARLLQQE